MKFLLITLLHYIYINIISLYKFVEIKLSNIIKFSAKFPVFWVTLNYFN